MNYLLLQKLQYTKGLKYYERITKIKHPIFFGREKNAKTEYYVGAVPEDGTEEVEWLRLAKWISSVTDDTEEEVEDMAFYDGDGTPEDDVISVKKNICL